MYRVKDLYENHKDLLGLELMVAEGLTQQIKVPEAHRPGLSLCGFLKNHAGKRILIFGKVEIQYLKDLKAPVRIERLKAILDFPTPCVMVGRSLKAPKELIDLCQKNKIALFSSTLNTMNLINQLTLLLTEEFSPHKTCHGTLVEVFGVGVLIQGDSSIGKSETALGLIERGHRLIADDCVKVKRKEGNYLEGSCAPITKHHMEIRGIGIINIAHLYGAVCVRDSKSIDIVVKLESWDDNHFYDRLGVDEKVINLLGIDLPFHVLPVKPGRDVVLLLETIALNHRLKQMGYHSAKEFQMRFNETVKQSKSEK